MNNSQPFYNASQPHYPIYYITSPQLITGVSDVVLLVVSPVLSYWILALFFYFLDTREWRWLEKYRFHESPEVTSRYSPSVNRVVCTVLFQQSLKIAFGLSFMQKETVRADHSFEIRRVALFIDYLVQRVFAYENNEIVMRVAYYAYWWAIPALQFGAGMFLFDTWFYFGHLMLHKNEFLYKHIHSFHHRIYVPYAIGTYYTHPVEVVLIDSLGRAMVERVTRMTTRQAIALFQIAILKAVDDHSRYNLPFDPFQMFTGNTAEYHDIHHQRIGIKSNFAQPFFVHWDTWMGTRMTRKDVEARKLAVSKNMKLD